MEAIEITPADTEAADAIVDMWVNLATGQREFGSHVPGDPNRNHIRESIFRHIASDRLLVARRDELCGFVMFAVEHGEFEQDVDRGIVENLYVDPTHRNEEIGTSLLEAAETALERKGVDAITLSVMAGNADARRLYRRHGYEPHRVEMEKDLGV